MPRALPKGIKGSGSGQVSNTLSGTCLDILEVGDRSLDTVRACYGYCQMGFETIQGSSSGEHSRGLAWTSWRLGTGAWTQCRHAMGTAERVLKLLRVGVSHLAHDYFDVRGA